MKYIGCVLVEDWSGAHFNVFEYRDRRFFRHVSRYILDTGEVVRPVDANTFALVRTGETLVKVR